MVRVLLLVFLVLLGPVARAETLAPPAGAPPAPLAQSAPPAPLAQAAPAAPSAQSAPAAMTPDAAARAAALLHDPKAVASLAAVLDAMAHAAPAPAPSATPALVPNTPPAVAAATAHPGTAAVPAAGVAPAVAAPSPVEKKSAEPSPAEAAAAGPITPIAPDSLVARLAAGASETVAETSRDLRAGLAAARSLPSLWTWVVTMTSDPLARATLMDTLWRLGIAVVIALAVEWGVWQLLTRPRGLLAARAPRAIAVGELQAAPLDDDSVADAAASAESATASASALTSGGTHGQLLTRRATAWSVLRRLPLVLGMMTLDLLPIAAFFLVGHVLAATNLAQTNFVHVALLAVVTAYAACNIVLAVGRMMLAPDFPRLRLLAWSDAAAAYGVRWLRRIVVVFLVGDTVATLGLQFGLSTAGHDALLKAGGLVVHAMLAIVVWQKRRAVRAVLRAPPGATDPLATLRNRFASIWHWVALFYIAAIWIVWAVEVRDGYARMVHVFAVFVATVVVARLISILALGALDRAMLVRPTLAARLPGLAHRARFYHPILRAALVGLMWAMAMAVLLQLCGIGTLVWLVGTTLGLSVLGAMATITVTFALALAVWEGVNVGLELHLARLDAESRAARAARLRTLLPLLRTLLLGALAIIVGLTVLSVVGVNIGPLLAGAGILGVAIGFGSQKLVQDLITGIFLLLENAMQVGDWVTVSGLSGSVEALSVRTIRLRDSDGSIHIIPFSAVTTVTNTNRGLGNAAVSVTVPFEEDVDRVSGLLGEIVDGLRADDAFAPKILGPLQLWGVDKVDGSSVTILGQIGCTDAGRWSVQREFNRRLKQRFQRAGIKLYNPSRQFVLDHLPPVAANASNRLPKAGE